MTSKFEAYDLFGIMVPGLLLIGWVAFCFPGLGTTASLPFPDAFDVLLLTALAVFAGHSVQAISSVIEPLVFLTWGGRPSDRALDEGLKGCLPMETVTRIKGKLNSALESNSETHSLFIFALQLSDGQGVGRARRFNSLYAYHRGVLTLLLICIGIAIGALACSPANTIGAWQIFGFSIAAIAMVALFWLRAKQQANYYVREVLLSAEFTIDERNRKDR